jgi:hypothetical protein
MKCHSCGAPISIHSTKCEYCGAIVSSHNSLTIEKFLDYIEQEFKVRQDNYDGQVGLVFLVLTGLWVGLSWAAYTFASTLAFIITLLIAGFTFFMIFGFLIIQLQRKAILKALDEEHREIIQNYVHVSGIVMPEFKLKAKEHLHPDSVFLKYLSDI